MKKQKKFTFFRNKNIIGVEICRVEKSQHFSKTHKHNDLYALNLVINRSKTDVNPGPKEITVHAGDLAFSEFTDQIKENADIPLSAFWMLYAETGTFIDFSSNFLNTKQIVHEFRRIVSKNKTIAKKYLQLIQSIALNLNHLYLETLLSEFLGDLFAQTCDIKPAKSTILCDNQAVNLAKNYLSQDLDLGLSLDNVASRVGVSRFHFIRLFKQYTGLSPHQFRIQRRIQAAKGLIKSGIPFSEVALETGFSDQSHFTNKFRQYTGATPSQYAHL